MGEVVRPERLSRRRRGPTTPDISGDRPPKPPIPPSLEAILEEVRDLREDLEKLKKALRAHGIILD